MSRLARPATRLAAGSRIYARRLASRAAAWCARGRRTDLTGWRACLGIWLRIVLLLAGAYLLARIVRALPVLLWLLSAWWITASWRAGRPPAKAPEEPSVGAAPALEREAVRTLLLDLMGSGPAVQLRTVLAHLHQHPSTAGLTAHWTVTDLRARLAALEVPMDRGVKVSGVPTWGVRRRDLVNPSPPTAEETSTAPSTAA